MGETEAKLETAREELLDLSLRNKLINYRPLKTKGVEVVDELPQEVFRILVTESRTMSFLPAPEEGDEETESKNDDAVLLAQPEDEDNESGIAQRHADRRLQTAYTSANLQKRLLSTFYAARTYIEEQGVNILYLALGMLRWYEAENSDIVRQAPLILIPVELYRTNVRTRFRMRYTEEEIDENLSLRAKLKADFAIELPDFPEDEELDVLGYFDRVEHLIRHQARWSVDHSTIALGFFSFGTFLMYNDLDPAMWPEGNKPTDHPLLESLMAAGFDEPPPAIGNDEHLDRHVSPQESFQVVDADSSQTLAILDVLQGRNLLIQGPPGTGKSQTITNLVAEALARDKTVLFVAEKMAALEVVKRRLDEVGLGAACLELHSHKTNKKAFLEELQNTLELGKPRTRDSSTDLRALVENRERLNAYSEAVNTPIGESGLTPYQVYGRLLHLKTVLETISVPELDQSPMKGWSGATFRQWLDRVEGLQALLRRMGVPADHPFWGSTYTSYLPSDRRAVQASADATGRALQRLQQAGRKLAGHLGLSAPADRTQSIQLSQAAEKLLSAPPLEGVRVLHQAWARQAAEVKKGLVMSARLAELHKKYDALMLPEAWEQDVLAIRTAYANYGQKWWRMLSSSFRKAKNDLTGLTREGLPDNVDEQKAMVEAIMEAQRLQPTFDECGPLLSQLFGGQWRGLESEWSRLADVTDWLITFYQAISAGLFPRQLTRYLADEPDFKALRDLAAGLEEALDAHSETATAAVSRIQLDEVVHFEEGTRFVSSPYGVQQRLLRAWYSDVDRLQEMVNFNHLSRQFQKAGLENVVAIAASWPLASTHLAHLFERTWHELLLEQAVRERPELRAFDGETHGHRIAKFREADQLQFRINRTELADKHWQQLPRYSAGGQLGILQREFAKKRRHLPIRKLMRNAGNAIQTIKPVFMMSPLSIAMFLPPESVSFDLVIFDEASQVRPVEAFGAILRGEQVVVVGDSRQLPPTNFFTQLVELEDGEESPTADLESVLSLFAAQGAPQRMLRWHYRSRHESLIAVSNHEFYDNRLVIFPSPDAHREEVGLVFHHLPDTVYDRGRTRTNPEEARIVAEKVMEHVRSTPDLTLGVAAFSISQAQAIQDELEILRRQNPSYESFFNTHPAEPFFVKNLENVQGDERDVIYISVGYGRSEGGYLTMNFGPINKDGGERRLNVLITRARLRCEIFSNLTDEDIDLRRTGARGVVALKRYLKYARTGHLDMPLATDGDADSYFEEMVANALRSAGYEVVHQVGSAGFYIDLAIVDKERPGRYLLGIECDGATYHRARSARDRDRLRQQVLEGLGWRIHRIWSTDWFRNPQRELRRTVEAIEAARAEKTNGQKKMATESPSVPLDSKPIERHQPVPKSEALQATNYELAQLRLPPVAELHNVSRRQLAGWIQQVVEIEGPVHFDEAARRVADAAGVMRVGSRIREALEGAVAYAVRSGHLSRRGQFLWPANMKKAPSVRSHANVQDFSRTIDQIAPEEIILAIEMVVESALGMLREEIPPAVCSLFGFGRTSKAMRKHVDALVHKMIESGELVAQGSFLIVPNDK